MADAQHPRPVVLDARNKAADLCRADVERRDEAAAWPDRRFARLGLAIGLGLWGFPAAFGARRRFIHCCHVFFADGRPFFVGGASFGASGLTRTTRRSGRRTSTVWTSRLRMALDRSSRASSAQAAEGASAGRRTSIVLSMRRFHRRSPTRTAAVTREARSGSVASM